MQTPTNVEQLRKSLLTAFGWVQSNPKKATQVKEMANVAGKVISSVKVELEYALLRKETPNIAFLNYVRR